MKSLKLWLIKLISGISIAAVLIGCSGAPQKTELVGAPGPEFFQTADTISFPVGGKVLPPLTGFYYSYPFLVAEFYIRTANDFVEQQFFVKNLKTKEIHQIKKEQWSPAFKYWKIDGVFPSGDFIYVSIKHQLYQIKEDGRVVSKVTLQLPTAYNVFSRSMLRVDENHLYVSMIKQDSSFNATFCTPNVFQLGVFNRAGDFLYSIPVMSSTALCGAECTYRYDLFQYLISSEGVMMFNVFEKECYAYNRKGGLTGKKALEFLPFLNRQEMVAPEENSLMGYVPHTSLVASFTKQKDLYVVKSGSDNNHTLIISDLKTGKATNSIPLKGQFIGFEASHNAMITIEHLRENTFVIIPVPIP